MKTYNDIYLELRHKLREAGIDNINFEARLIISAAAKKSKEEFTRDLKLYAADDMAEKIDALAARRMTGEPLAYVLGEWEFMGLPMHVEPGVLIPRIDTEVLAELALKLLHGGSVRNNIRVLDLCCGTGCIGISVAAKAPDARVILADNSMKALRISRTNVLRNNVTRNVTVIEADARKTPPALMGKFDLIVCNPPYIATEEVKTLDSSVKDFEPSEALDGGADGLDYYRDITALWKTVLKPRGCLMYECGEEQAPRIKDIMSREGFDSIASYKDTAGTERVVAGIMGGNENG